MAANNFDTAYSIVKKLIKDFQDGSARYMRSDYKEQAVRVDFIDPFFEALGWDVNHKHQRDPFKREVEAERSEKEGRVDYSFHLAPDFKTPVFFVEAKKPFVDIKNELHYLQTIKYSWNAGLPISVLTDFQQFHILDCRGKVKAGDGSAFSGDHKEYHFTDFLDKEKFAEVYYLFSHEGVEAGNIQKYVDKLRKPKGKAVQTGLFKGGYRSVDEDFLAYIDELREELAKALKKNNEELGSEELTEATQRIIDRLVFIRFLEDKEILDKYFVSDFGARGNTWQDFVTTCLTLNTEYNGVVFKKHFIDDRHFAGPDDKMFRDICRDICHLNSAYNFNYIPIHILGSIYEQFLGKVVHATDKRVKIEEKPEVRKAGGVYYTPKYIVEYIVENTIGKLIKDKSPKEIAKLRFADIACGSGSFLISVYEHLLDYHTVYYNKHENIVQAQKDGCRKDEDGLWQLSIAQKQGILTNNIYGVDIDAQAVEVTQLSLYLKMLENENVVTVANHLHKKGKGALFGADKVLPDLSNNIKCGNSLIGSDILNGQLFADEELKKLNPFDYEVEFKQVFKQGGFDAIVGNPPYRTLQLGKKQDSESPVIINYYQLHYPNSFDYKVNLHALFIERCIQLIKANGLLSYIVPNTFYNTVSFKGLRFYLLKKGGFNIIADLKFKVFKDAEIGAAAVFVFENASATQNTLSLTITDEKEFPYPINGQIVDKKSFLESSDYNLIADSAANKILKTIAKQTDIVDLGSVVKIYQGIITGDNKKYLKNFQDDKKWQPILKGRDINRYSQPVCKTFVYYDPEVLWSNTDLKMFKVAEKIISRQTSDRLIATLDTDAYFSLDSTHVIHFLNDRYQLKYLLAIYNSSLFNYLYQSRVKEVGRAFAQVKTVNLKPLPFKALDLNVQANKAKHDHIVSLVEQMLEGKKKLDQAKTDKDKEFYNRKCEALDKQIDDAVFELYGLTEEEKEIVLNS